MGSTRDGRSAPQHRPKRSPPTGARSRPSPTWSARRTSRRPAYSSAATRPTRPTVSRFRSSSPTTCWRGTAPAPSWRFPAATSATGTSPRSSACRSSKSLPAAIFRKLRTPATGAGELRLPRRDERGVGEGGHHRAAGGRRQGQGPRRVQIAGLAVRQAAVLGRAVPDRLRRERPRAPAARVRSCPSSYPMCRTIRRCCSIPTTPTASRRRR